MNDHTVLQSFGIYPDTIEHYAEFYRNLISAIDCKEKQLDSMAYDIFKNNDDNETDITNKIIIAYATAATELIQNAIKTYAPDSDVAITFSVNCDDSHFFINDFEIHDCEDLADVIHDIRCDDVFEQINDIFCAYNDELISLGLDPNKVVKSAKEEVSKTMRFDETYDAETATDLFNAEIKIWISEVSKKW